VTNQTITLSQILGFSLQIFPEEFAEAIELEWVNFDGCFMKWFKSEKANEDRLGKRSVSTRSKRLARIVLAWHRFMSLQHFI
jgi:hypothetical protein